MKLFLTFTVVLSAHAAISIEVAGVTHVSAQLRYTAPSASTCTVEVSKDPSYSPLIYDVDGSLFTNENLDSRTSGISSGTRRVFILGGRHKTGVVGTTVYTRALAQSTTYYFRVSGCGDTGTGQFTTRTIPWGETDPQTPQYTAGGIWNYPWPTVDWNNRQNFLTDPMTGLEMKPISGPGDYGNTYPSSGQFLFGSSDFVVCGVGWTNCGNARSGSSASIATFTAGTPTAIYLGIDPTVSQAGLQNLTGMFNKVYSIDDFSAILYGSGSDATASNRQISACWSLDWATCYTNSVTITFPQTTDACVGETWGGAINSGCPSSTITAKAFFSAWGKAMNRLQLGRTGTMSVTAGAFTIASPGPDSFTYWEWVAGTKIWIEGSSGSCQNNLCTIATVTGPGTGTLAEALTVSNKIFKQAPALRVIKTTSTGNLNLSAAHRIAVSANATLPPGGSIEWANKNSFSYTKDCAGNTISSRAGRLGVIQLAIGNDTLYRIGEDGETCIISGLTPKAAANRVTSADDPCANGACAYPVVAGFDANNANTLYVVFRNSDLTKKGIWRLQYTGDYSKWPVASTYPLGNATQPGSPDDGVTWTNLTLASSSHSIQQLVDGGCANCVAYSKANWGDLDTTAISAAVAGTTLVVFKQGWGAGESSACWAFAFDISGAQAILIRSWNNFDGALSPYHRWTACHANLAMGGQQANNFFQSFNLNRSQGGDSTAYRSTVTHAKKASVWNTNTSIPSSYDGSYDGACPGNSYGYSGNNCVQIRISGDVCRPATLSSPDEHTIFPCPRNTGDASLAGGPSNSPGSAGGIAIGDVAYDWTVDWDLTERFVILAIVKNSATDFELTLGRDYIKASDVPRCDLGSRNHPNAAGWQFAMAVGVDKNSRRTCNGSGITIDAVSGTVYAQTLLSHFDHGASSNGLPRLVQWDQSYRVGGLAAMAMALPDVTTKMLPEFAGATDAAQVSFQTYPGCRIPNASADDGRMCYDQHHIGASCFETLTAVSGSLYRLSGCMPTIDIKRMPISAFAGPYLMQDVSSSSTGNLIGTTSADYYKSCYAYRNDECRSGSTAGQFFVNMPSPQTSSISCQYPTEGLYGWMIPCGFTGSGMAGWAVQALNTANDPEGYRVRRLSMNPGPVRQPGYENTRPTPDGLYAASRHEWEGGLYTGLWLMRVPHLSPRDSVNRATFQRISVNYTGGSSVTLEFGYGRFGAPVNFYCTSRAETCRALTSYSESTPFKFAHESSSSFDCTSGCTFTIPALSGSQLSYRIVDSTEKTREVIGVY